MQPHAKTVISASRRTDIPAFYLDWFISSMNRGIFSVQHPCTKKIAGISIPKQDIHSIVFWSKNYREFIRNVEIFHGLNLYFHFTINAHIEFLEPNVPVLEERLQQIEFLTRKFSPHAVSLRFDPVIFFKKKNTIRNNLSDFEKILSHAQKLGLDSVITSFMSPYRKIEKREQKISGFRFIYPCFEEKVQHLERMSEISEKYGIKILLCCEKELAALKIRNTEPASCISVKKLIDLYGEGPDAVRDKSQRISRGCGCEISVDVGSYGLQPCRCGCLYCYANPER
jgi:DNA repair photolyase